MCGIWAKIWGWTQGTLSETSVADDSELNCRGPDSHSQVTVGNVELAGYVLHLRGELTQQPFGKDSSWLLWNGELYGNNVFGQHDLDLSTNDTQQIYNLLKIYNPVQILSEIEACFAFVYLNRDELWFGRDFLGRRSLILGSSGSSSTISSVGNGNQIPTGGIFKLCLKTFTCEQIPWTHSGLITPSQLRFGAWDFPTLPVFEAIEKSVQKRLVGLGEIGILFSGGLDCSVIAALCCKFLQSQIFLLNVSFEENSPDRITAIGSFEEIQKIFGIGRVRLILIDVGREEVGRCKERIVRLIGGNDSRMDFSIATALFFASRGEGVDFCSGEVVRFPGKILFSGMGADEIFGGYSRYKSSFKHYGNEGVNREMSLDLDRLWHRNMGRDDRIVSCHSKELRFPYLDTHLWLSLSKLNLESVTLVNVPGQEKYLLREFAKTLGFEQTATYKKRAIQFGTRISQQCNRQDFGSNRKAKGWQSMNKDKDSQIETEIQYCCKELESKIQSQPENIEKLRQVIDKLTDSKVSINDKRHLMRVYLGDYVSVLSSVCMDDE